MTSGFGAPVTALGGACRHGASLLLWRRLLLFAAAPASYPLLLPLPPLHCSRQRGLQLVHV